MRPNVTRKRGQIAHNSTLQPPGTKYSTTVVADFGPEVEISRFLRMRGREEKRERQL